MRSLVAMLFSALALTAQAGQEEGDFSPKTKVSISAAVAPAPGRAPFLAAHDPMPELALRDEQEHRGPLGACASNGNDVCYDLASGNLVYRPARQFMPNIQGLKAESISVRHDRIIFKYSF